ncbi:MAG: AMP-binding protein [Acidimicrobiia bacterium]|nr:AMP-binding protein [Acidimicrobiia bacterium]
MAELGFTAHAGTMPDKPALVLGDDRRTFAELDGRSTRLAHALADQGVAERGRVAMMLPNGFELAETGLAAAKLGASVVPVNWHLKADELAWILEDSGASVLVAHGTLRSAYDRARAAEACDLLVVAGDGTEPSYEAAIAAVPAGVPHLAAETMASPVFYMSGTTGRPKGVVHGYLDRERSRMAQLGQVQLWGWTADDVYLLSGPAYHAGPGGYLMAALFVGATTVILPHFDAREWLQAVSTHRGTISFMVPAHFIRILEVPEEERARHDLSSLRLIVHGGAPCPVPVKRRIIDALAPAEIWELYGASEGGATRISPREWLEHPGSVGTPWPGVEVRILDGDGRPLPPGRTGIVHIRPAGGARFHYHDDEEKTAGAWHDDAFTVGDVGYLDEDGYLYLTDRATDMVIRGGVNVYPREIEEVLHRHPEVVDCAVFGVPDERLGENLAALVETRRPVRPDELQAWCRERLADFKVPALVRIVDELPRQPNGKVLKRLLRQGAWDDRDREIG